MTAPWTGREDAALRALWDAVGEDWPRHKVLDEHGADVLARRSQHERARRLDAIRNWPEPGVIIFHDDPRAVRDHGSPGRVSAAVTRSMSGSSAAWAMQR